MRFEGENFTTSESENRHLAFDNEFRKLLKENPGVIGATSEMMKEAEEEYDPPNMLIGTAPLEMKWNKEKKSWEEVRCGDDVYDEPLPVRLSWRGVFFSPGELKTNGEKNLEVQLLGRSDRVLEDLMGKERRDRTDYFSVNLKGERFFVKKSSSTFNPGFTEFKNAVKAKELLADLDFIKVIEPQLGYCDDHQSWYVSKWEELETAGFGAWIDAIGHGFNDYGKVVNPIYNFPLPPEEIEMAKEKHGRMEEKFNIVSERLSQAGIGDDLMMNMFCNPDTETFILLDVTNVKEPGIGQEATDS